VDCIFAPAPKLDVWLFAKVNGEFRMKGVFIPSLHGGAVCVVNHLFPWKRN